MEELFEDALPRLSWYRFARWELQMRTRWTGPYTIDELLSGLATGKLRSPPTTSAAYLVSEEKWAKSPSQSCRPLYVGGNTGKSPRFRTRMGDLIADMHGFFCNETGHHSGGQSLYRYCRDHHLNPQALWIGWIQAKCGRCLEGHLHSRLKPLLNKRTPPPCGKHRV